MEKVQVVKVGAAEAARLMAAAGLASADGIATPDTIAAAGECFKLTFGPHEGVFALERHGSRMWISGAGAVETAGLTVVGLPVIEAISRQVRCDRVGFQTARPGLVKLAKKQGYRIKGFILEKEL
jgi:hypothetical protein